MPSRSACTSFSIFIASTMQITCPALTRSPSGGGSGERRTGDLHRRGDEDGERGARAAGRHRLRAVRRRRRAGAHGSGDLRGRAGGGCPSISMTERRAFCSEVSRENAEPLAATASHVGHWLLVEYRGLWSHDALAGSGLSDQVKAHLREQAAARPRTKLLLVRRVQRRRRRGVAVYWGSSPERGGE